MKGVYGPLPTEETVFFDDQGQPATEEENEASVAAAAMAAADETTFPRFPELPTELRFLIWELALPRRVFEIRQETATVNSNGEASIDEHAINRSLDHPEPIAALLAPPVLLQVCREARKVAMRTGSWKYVGSLSYEKNSIDRLRTWFDPSTDTLCFDNSWAIQSVQGPFREQNGIVMEPGNNPAITRVYFGNSPASPICLSLHALTDVSGKFYAEQWKRRRGFWSGVPRYMFYHDSIRLCLGRSSRVQEIFGKDADRCHTLLVDAHDYAKLQQLRELFLGECNAADTYSDGPYLNDLNIIVDPDSGYIDQCYRDLKNIWLQAQGDIPLSATILTEDQISEKTILTEMDNRVIHGVQDFNHTDPWSKKIISNMPKMELVVHFRLCFTNHDEDVMDSGMWWN